MTVHVATLTELQNIGDAAVGSVEGQTALALATALDDRAGAQAGGLASTAKELRALMAEIRDRYKPVERSALTLLRGDGVA
jgi:hypothetical protein